MENVLIIDDELSMCTLLEKFLSKKGFNVESTTSGNQGINLMKDKFYEVILCDYRLTDITAEELFEKIKTHSPGSIVIFITGYANLNIAVNLIKEGAYHYLAKPLNPDELLEIINNSISENTGESRKVPSESEDSTERIEDSQPLDDYVYGSSQASRKMMEYVKLVGPTNYTVIIEGETGTGKESLAKLIHLESSRKSKPFMPIDCGSLSKEIAASELFGHEKGAFTGAVSAKPGVFELAEGGTVFLDEIANLSMDIQIALLRALQEKIIRRVGSLKEIPVNVRIIAATNENLFDNSGSNRFREDLYYRLNEFTLKAPSLRDRIEDLPLFIEFFLDKTCIELDNPRPTISDEVWECFKEYSWPGNIREVKNLIRRACLLTGKSGIIGKEVLPEHITSLGKLDLGEVGIEGEYLADLDLKSASMLAESKHILETLDKVHYNKTLAAKMLNIDRKTLYSKIKMFNIKV
ncbi:MAG: sigma-54 dependent transcriptional regulator [Anditalea sp.]